MADHHLQRPPSANNEHGSNTHSTYFTANGYPIADRELPVPYASGSPSPFPYPSPGYPLAEYPGYPYPGHHFHPGLVHGPWGWGPHIPISPYGYGPGIGYGPMGYGSVGYGPIGYGPPRGGEWMPWSRQLPPLQGGPERVEQRPPRSEHIDWSSRYPNEVILHGPRNVKEVAFSFDDGPDDEWTPQILSVLKQHRIKATFFCVGSRVKQNPDVMRSIVQSGHAVGNHTYTHPKLTDLTPTQIQTQLEQTAAEIQKASGVRPTMVRPPYGAINEAVITQIQSMKQKIILWDVDSLDWARLTGPQVVANVLSHTHYGSIVLMHSAGGRGESLEDTVQALPIIFQTLAEEGYRFTTIPDLLNL